MKTKDGYLMVGAAGEAIWARCAEALGHPEWCEDPRFATNRQRMQNRAALEGVMEAVLATKTAEHWVEVLEAAGVPCGRSMITRKCLTTRRCATAGSCNMRAIRNWARCRTSAPLSGSARVCGCAMSTPSSASQYRDLWRSRRDRCGDAAAVREGRAVIRCVLTRIPGRRSQFYEHLGRFWYRLQYLGRDREKRGWLARGAGAPGATLTTAAVRGALVAAEA
jgi:hypothetical protein